jgi:hypothetical protein
MALQFSTQVRNARLDAVETSIGAGPTLRIYSGAKPALITDLATGVLLAEKVLPTDWMAAASAGSKAKLGDWTMTGHADAGAGTNAGYFRISQGTTVHAQGTVTATGSGGDMTIDNPSIAYLQTVIVDTFTLNEGNA